MSPGALWGRRSRALSVIILLLASGLGVWGFLSPFFVTPPAEEIGSGRAGAHAGDALYLTLGLLALCLLVVIADLETGRMDSRRVAILGVLVGINAILRLFSGPAGVTAIFFLPIVCGFVFGAEFGFLLGALSILASAILTSGLGPWLPFQMFATGWVAMIAGWLPRSGRPRRDLALLAAWGFVSALFFGAVVNLWFWPYLPAADGGEQVLGSAAAGAGLGLRRAAIQYGLFYLTTSLWWDLARAAGSVALLLVVGPPVLRLLERFRRRFDFEEVTKEAPK